MSDTAIQAGVVVKTRFVDKKLSLQKGKGKEVQSFQSYIDYMDRDEAVRGRALEQYDLFYQYTDYMANPEKTTGLFTADKDRLQAEDMEVLKRGFQSCYDHDGILWQTVLSFDNRYLAKHGIYDPATNTLNVTKLQDLTRKMMDKGLKKESMSDTAVWTASVHYNTDNIHVHIATIEPIPTRERGKWKPQTLEAMRSAVVNQILSPDHALLDELIRKRMVAGKRTTTMKEDPTLHRMCRELMNDLPTDKRLWFYNTTAMLPYRKQLDAISQHYIDNHHASDFAEFRKTLLKQEAVLKESYGQDSQAEQYAKNKMDDLYSRMGNAILKELREETKRQDKGNRLHRTKVPNMHYSTDRLVHTIKRALRAEYKQKNINQREFEQLHYEMGGE